MGMVYADPDMLERLAKSMDSKAGSIPGLKTRASTLGVSSQVAGLTSIATYLGEEARTLRKKAAILRAPSESPFDSLSQFGLPPGLAKRPHAGDKFESGLRKVLAEHKGDDPKARAQAVKDYFATLKPEEQAALTVVNPSLVGNLDGVPPNVRFAANRISIQNEYDKEKKYLDGLSKNDPAYKRTQSRVDTLRSFLNPRVRTVRDPKTHRFVTEEVPRQFLVFQPDAGSTADPKATPFADGKVTEVVGDLETAKNVTFRVPGITNRLDNFNGFGSGAYEALLKSSCARLAEQGWKVLPEVTDSEDRSALVGKRGLVSGRLYASNQGLTFTGEVEA
ncbi:hypothetical protein [Streptomyces sp. NPDC001020]